jgi:aminotransferase
MSRLCAASGGVNLAQGFPDFACPQELKDAAKAAIDADVNQYAITWGAKAFRDGIAAKVAQTYPGWTVDPETELCVTCGSTEAMIATLLGHGRPRRRGDRLRAVLRELRPRRVLSERRRAT